MSLPRIPVIKDKELAHATSALANAAFLMRGIFIQLSEGKLLDEILTERGGYILMANAVIDQWCKYFGIDGDEMSGPE